MTFHTTAADLLPPPVLTATSSAQLRAPGSIVEHTAATGLRIVAVRRPSVPVVELRLAVPFGGDDPAHAATAEVLAAVLLGSTGGRDRAELEAELGLLGGSLNAKVTPQTLSVYGAVAADGLARTLVLLGETLADPRRPADEVSIHRNRLLDRLRAYRAQPGVAARAALLEHCFPGHPLAREVPSPEDVAVVDDAGVAALHSRALLPRGSRLLLVGALDPASAVTVAEHAFSAWTGPGAAVQMPDVPAPIPGIAVRGRPGGRQVQIRLMAQTPRVEDPEYPAMRLANLILGAFFGSRLLGRLREREGLTYHVHTSHADYLGRSLLMLEFDTAPSRLAAALSALREELDRYAEDEPPSDEEITAARGFAVGSGVIRSATQAGTADLLHALPPATALANWLPEQLERIAQVTRDEVRAVAGRLAAANFAGIVQTAPDGVEQAGRDLGAAGFRTAD